MFNILLYMLEIILMKLESTKLIVGYLIGDLPGKSIFFFLGVGGSGGNI